MKKPISHFCDISGFIRALGVDLHRAVLTRRFLLKVGLLLDWMFANGATKILIYEFLYVAGIPFTFEQAMVGHDGLGMIVLAMATIPHGTGYLTDRESGFEYYAIKRIGFPAYATAKVMSAGLSAFFAMVTASGIFLSGLCLTGAGHTVPGGGEYLNGAYYDLVILVGPWFYYFARMMVSGLTAALASVFALYITTLIPNAYVALLSPLIGYYAYDSIILGVVSSLTNRAPYLRLFGIQNIMTFLVSQHNVGFSLLWAVVFLLTMTVLCGRGFVLQLRKEQGL